jgi:uncharacterized protein YecA (UPF0149 family)
MNPFLYYLNNSICSQLHSVGYCDKHYRSKPELARKKTQPRNEKCNCGSGKKYKNCCGK